MVFFTTQEGPVQGNFSRRNGALKNTTRAVCAGQYFTRFPQNVEKQSIVNEEAIVFSGVKGAVIFFQWTIWT
jgi:hypothetical protein